MSTTRTPSSGGTSRRSADDTGSADNLQLSIIPIRTDTHVVASPHGYGGVGSPGVGSGVTLGTPTGEDIVIDEVGTDPGQWSDATLRRRLKAVIEDAERYSKAKDALVDKEKANAQELERLQKETAEMRRQSEQKREECCRLAIDTAGFECDIRTETEKLELSRQRHITENIQQERLKKERKAVRVRNSVARKRANDAGIHDEDITEYNEACSNLKTQIHKEHYLQKKVIWFGTKVEEVRNGRHIVKTDVSTARMPEVYVVSGGVESPQLQRETTNETKTHKVPCQGLKSASVNDSNMLKENNNTRQKKIPGKSRDVVLPPIGSQKSCVSSNNCSRRIIPPSDRAPHQEKSRRREPALTKLSDIVSTKRTNNVECQRRPSVKKDPKLPNISRKGPGTDGSRRRTNSTTNGHQAWIDTQQQRKQTTDRKVEAKCAGPENQRRTTCTGRANPRVSVSDIPNKRSRLPPI